MVFEHLIFNLAENEENSENEKKDQIYILLDDKDIDDENARIAAQAISLDIRGDFGFFLNRVKYKWDNNRDYEWTGNLFNIMVKPNEEKVIIVDNTEEDEHGYIIELNEWQEALLDWKKFYLDALGFLKFKSKALSHMFGVLLLTYDQIGENCCSDEMIIEAIKMCSRRYGISCSVIYRDCVKVTGVQGIRAFYDWVIGLFVNENRALTLHEQVLIYLNRFYQDIRPELYRCFDIV